jgi:hypothetical protein
MKCMKTSYATSCNGIHMLCLNQTHIHTDISSMITLIIHNIFSIINYARHAECKVVTHENLKDNEIIIKVKTITYDSPRPSRGQ